MPLEFPSHEDVVFKQAPLERVLCQIRFAPVYALLDDAGVSGFQEAIRRSYPHTQRDMDASVKLAPNRAEVRQAAPIWRFRDVEPDLGWQVSLAVDFVSLDTPSYAHFDDFVRRLDYVLDALERTVKPGRAQRIGLRKINRISHPQVSQFEDWVGLLRSGLLGLSDFGEMPGTLTRSLAEFNLDDGENGNLTVRHRIDEDDATTYRIDMDYWTTARRFEIRAGSDMRGLLKLYSDSMTGLFHWVLERDMYDYLEPMPRSQADSQL